MPFGHKHTINNDPLESILYIYSTRILKSDEDGQPWAVSKLFSAKPCGLAVAKHVLNDVLHIDLQLHCECFRVHGEYAF